MKRSIQRLSSLLSAAVLLVCASASAQDEDLARLFPREITVSAETGPASLAIPADVLGTARPDLADVRLFDASGDELPFFVDSGARPVASDVGSPTVAIALGATRRSSGVYVTESFDLAPPPRSAVPYVLSLTTNAPDFVRDLRIVVVGSDGAVAPIPLVDTTIFRFRSPQRERISFPLPPVPAGARALRVTIAGQSAGLGWGNFYGALEPVFTYEPTFTPLNPPTLALALTISARRHVDKQTVLDVELPLGIRPDRLRIATSAPNFVRGVRVDDAEHIIGNGDVFRIESLMDRGGEWLEVPVGRAHGEKLTVTIDDGDSPALAALQLVAIVRQPSLVFFAHGGELTLRYGGGRARAPRYDLEALGRVGLTGTLLDGDALRRATPGAPRPNPHFDSAPALAFLARPGVVVDARRYTHVAELVVPDAREGIVRVRVPAAAVSVARTDLGDVRIVSADGRQWPYVQADGEQPRVDLPVVVGAPAREGRETRYALRLPVTSAFVAALRLDVDSRFTERPFKLMGENDDGVERELVSGYLSRGPEERGPIVREIRSGRAQNLVLVVEDGDDAPLVVRSAVIVARVAELHLAAPAGTYRLLAGDPAAEPPRYELDRAHALIAAVPIGEAHAARVSKNPAFHEPGFFERTGWQAIALWISLGLAVLVLGGLTLRLARMEGDGNGAPSAAPSATRPAESSSAAAASPAASGGPDAGPPATS